MRVQLNGLSAALGGRFSLTLCLIFLIPIERNDSRPLKSAVKEPWQRHREPEKIHRKFTLGSPCVANCQKHEGVIQVPILNQRRSHKAFPIRADDS